MLSKYEVTSAPVVCCWTEKVHLDLIKTSEIQQPLITSSQENITNQENI